MASRNSSTCERAISQRQSRTYVDDAVVVAVDDVELVAETFIDAGDLGFERVGHAGELAFKGFELGILLGDHRFGRVAPPGMKTGLVGDMHVAFPGEDAHVDVIVGQKIPDLFRHFLDQRLKIQLSGHCP